MQLFHYTSVPLAESILSSAIRNGHLTRGDGTILQPVVWLTTDPRPMGHGLTTGIEKMNAADIAHSERVQGGPLRNTRTLDKTQVRIAVDLDSTTSPGLMSFRNYANKYEDKTFAKALGLTTLFNLNQLTDKEIKRLYRTTTTKEATWWLSFDAIFPTSFAKVDFNLNGKFVPYDFEQHGREVMNKVGFAVVSPSALATLSEVLPPEHKFETSKAILICNAPDGVPTVAIRGGGATRMFDIESEALLDGSEDDHIAGLQGWIRVNKEELRARWTEAVGYYFEAYPGRKP